MKLWKLLIPFLLLIGMASCSVDDPQTGLQLLGAMTCDAESPPTSTTITDTVIGGIFDVLVSDYVSPSRSGYFIRPAVRNNLESSANEAFGYGEGNEMVISKFIVDFIVPPGWDPIPSIEQPETISLSPGSSVVMDLNVINDEVKEAINANYAKNSYQDLQPWVFWRPEDLNYRVSEEKADGTSTKCGFSSRTLYKTIRWTKEAEAGATSNPYCPSEACDTCEFRCSSCEGFSNCQVVDPVCRASCPSDNQAAQEACFKQLCYPREQAALDAAKLAEGKTWDYATKCEDQTENGSLIPVAWDNRPEEACQGFPCVSGSSADGQTCLTGCTLKTGCAQYCNTTKDDETKGECGCNEITTPCNGFATMCDVGAGDIGYCRPTCAAGVNDCKPDYYVRVFKEMERVQEQDQTWYLVRFPKCESGVVPYECQQGLCTPDAQKVNPQKLENVQVVLHAIAKNAAGKEVSSNFMNYTLKVCRSCLLSFNGFRNPVGKVADENNWCTKKDDLKDQELKRQGNECRIVNQDFSVDCCFLPFCGVWYSEIAAGKDPNFH